MNTATNPVAALAYPAPPAINLTQRQLMLGLAYMAYCGEGATGANAPQTILQNINSAIKQITLPGASQPLFTGWKVVWGPAVYTMPGALYQDNVMYVAANTNVPGQYAIAIRGTNFINEVDWLLEDFNVRQLMNWPLGATAPAPAGAAVAESTSIDLIKLQTMQDTVTTSLTLFDFLNSITANGPINLCVTGHSLGAVLASTLALFLLENNAVWANATASTVTCITFAGPTAGNLQFADHSNAAFAAANSQNPPPATVWDNTLQTNCDIIQSAYDAAPLMYNSANIENILGLYGNNIPFTQLTGSAAEEYAGFLLLLIEASALTYCQQYTQLAVANPGGAFPGVFNPPATPLPPPTSTSITLFLDYLKAFVAQAAWQHSNSYPNLLNIPDLLNPAIIVRNISAVSMDSFSTAIYFRDETYPVTITGSGFSSLVNPVLNAFDAPAITVTINSVDSDTQISATVVVPSSSQISVGQYYMVLSGSNGSTGYINSNSYAITVM